MSLERLDPHNAADVDAVATLHETYFPESLVTLLGPYLAESNSAYERRPRPAEESVAIPGGVPAAPDELACRSEPSGQAIRK